MVAEPQMAFYVTYGGLWVQKLLFHAICLSVGGKQIAIILLMSHKTLLLKVGSVIYIYLFIYLLLQW